MGAEVERRQMLTARKARPTSQYYATVRTCTCMDLYVFVCARKHAAVLSICNGQNMYIY
jgi:hypothetical protein